MDGERLAEVAGVLLQAQGVAHGDGELYGHALGVVGLAGGGGDEHVGVGGRCTGGCGERVGGLVGCRAHDISGHPSGCAGAAEGDDLLYGIGFLLGAVAVDGAGIVGHVYALDPEFGRCALIAGDAVHAEHVVAQITLEHDGLAHVGGIVGQVAVLTQLGVLGQVDDHALGPVPALLVGCYDEGVGHLGSGAELDVLVGGHGLHAGSHGTYDKALGPYLSGRAATGEDRDGLIDGIGILLGARAYGGIAEVHASVAVYQRELPAARGVVAEDAHNIAAAHRENVGIEV